MNSVPWRPIMQCGTLGARPRAPRSPWLLSAIAFLAACSSSTSVRPLGGTYDLASVQGLRLPQPLDSASYTPVVIAGTLDVGADTLELTLSLQTVDSTGRAVGAVFPLIATIPYVRHGDSLLTVSDTGSYGDGLGGLVPGAQQEIGRISGSNVQLDLYTSIASSTGFTNSSRRRFLFSPAP